MKYCYLLFLLLLTSTLTKAQLILNEASSDNASFYNETRNDYSDFIEIKNISSTTISLNGWYLSDKLSNLQKWPFFNDTVQAGQIKLILADGANSFMYYNDWQHTNFSIANTGETIYLSFGNTLIDSLVVPQLEANQSVGRSLSSNSATVYFNQATPDTVNFTPPYTGLASKPTVSIGGGYFTTQINLSATCPAGQTVVYTTNGSMPQSTSPILPGSLPLDTTRVVKYRCIGNNLLPGDIVTETYLFNETQNIPILSISTDSLNLYDSVYGAWAHGIDTLTWPPYNFYRHYRRPLKAEYFNQSIKLFGKDCSMETDGGSSISEPKHTINLKFNHSTLGSGPLNHALFLEDKPTIQNFESIKIRNGGNNYVAPQYGGGLLYTDAIAQRFAAHLNVPYAAYQPVLFLLNGKFFGLYEIREKVNESYFKTNYGIPEDSIVLTDHANFPTPYYYQFDSISNYLFNEPNKNTSLFLDTFKTFFDYYNFIDYHAHEVFFQNKDWHTPLYSNNLKLYKKLLASDKHYGWILYDYDAAFCSQNAGNFNALKNLMTDAVSSIYTNPFRAIIQNTQFKYDFANRYADLMNLWWHPDSISNRFATYNNNVWPETPREFSKWPFTTAAAWQNDYNQKTTCIPSLHSNGRNDCDSLLFNSAGLVPITFQTNPAGIGAIHLNTIDIPSFPWTGIYFQGAPITFSAQPIFGNYVFTHWDTSPFISNVLADTISNFVTQGVTFVANYQMATEVNQNETKQFRIYPNPCKNNLFIQYPQQSLHEVMVKNIFGQVVFHQAFTTNLNTSSLKNGTYYIELYDIKQQLLGREIFSKQE